ncbi:CU044_5270 family protein [Streptomyces sp. NPDC007076]|uniref:CU044_5270 family protein n=1 Tax=unclassified Streptomyces TaxID=2593676 RepID=UPI00340D5E3F
MDDLTSVKELEADTPPLTAEARAAARTRLMTAIGRESRRGVALALPRRTVFRVAVAATVAAAVAGTVLVVSADGGDLRSSRMTTLSAAQVLHKAADRTRSTGAGLPIPRNDQYFYTKTYITRTPVKGGKTRTWTDESWLSVDGSRPSRRQEHGKIHNDPPLGEHELQWPPNEYAKLQKWPTDPDELLGWLGHGRVEVVEPSGAKGGKAGGPAPDPDRMVFMEACLLMQGPRVMPPGLQAAAFEALAKLPRIKVDEDEVDALGRHGVGVSYPHLTFTFVFDRETYDYLGIRLKGSNAKRVDGEWRQVDRYFEMRSSQEVGVVDRIGQRPSGVG